MGTVRKALTYLVIVCLALICALNYELFVFPNQFAPSGLNGICTMIQHVFGLRVGYLSLIINIPLALMVFFLVSKPLALRSMVYVVAFSLGLLVLDHVDLSAFHYVTDTGTSTILGPLVAGIINGSCYSMLIQCSAYSGGIDFVASAIHKFHPEKNIFYLIFAMNVFIAGISFFVYDYNIEPVILCILYSFMSSTVSDRLNKSGRSAVRFEIITQHPNEIADAIIHQLHHSATLVPGRGVYMGKETNILICVVNKSQVATLARIVRSYPNTFAVVSQVSEVMGNFKHMNSDGKEEIKILDSADGKAI